MEVRIQQVIMVVGKFSVEWSAWLADAGDNDAYMRSYPCWGVTMELLLRCGLQVKTWSGTPGWTMAGLQLCIPP
jgi:hypothetical protein